MTLNQAINPHEPMLDIIQKGSESRGELSSYESYRQQFKSAQNLTDGLIYGVTIQDNTRGSDAK
jgi:hypothetical protein